IDHIINSCAKTSYMSGGALKCPIVFRGPAGFNPGYAAQHTQEFYNYYGSVPGLKVVAPYTASDHKRLLISAIRDDSPVVFLENEVLYSKEFNDSILDSPQALDQAVLLKEGSDLTIIGASLSLELAERAAIKTKFDCEIINLISIQPIDIETILKSLRKTKRAIILDYGWPSFGLASEITAQLYYKMENKEEFKIEKLTSKNTHVGYAETLEKMFYPSMEDLLLLIESIMR
ncbi:pyruvate dehydrogenase E1 component beta subunit, partial [Enteropsectra breve]